MRARLRSGRIAGDLAVGDHRVADGDRHRDVVGRLVDWLVEGGERATGVGRLHLTNRVFPTVGLADVETAELIVEHSGVVDLKRRLAFAQPLGHGEGRCLVLRIRRDLGDLGAATGRDRDFAERNLRRMQRDA